MVLPGIQELFVAFFTLGCLYHIQYIDLNVNENENMKQEIFCLVSISFQPLVLSTSLLSCLPVLLYFRSHFLYLDLLFFLASLNSCAMFPILRSENTSIARGNLFSPKQVNYSVFLWCFFGPLELSLHWTLTVTVGKIKIGFTSNHWGLHTTVRLVLLNWLGEL